MKLSKGDVQSIIYLVSERKRELERRSLKEVVDIESLNIHQDSIRKLQDICDILNKASNSMTKDIDLKK